MRRLGGVEARQLTYGLAHLSACRVVGADALVGVCVGLVNSFVALVQERVLLVECLVGLIGLLCQVVAFLDFFNLGTSLRVFLGVLLVEVVIVFVELRRAAYLEVKHRLFVGRADDGGELASRVFAHGQALGLEILEAFALVHLFCGADEDYVVVVGVIVGIVRP